MVGIALWIPLAALTMLLGFALLATLSAGSWPSYGNPDPKTLRLPFFHVAALLSYPVALISVPLGLLIAILAWTSVRRRDVIVFTVGAAGWAFILPLTGPLFSWLID